MNEQQAAQTRQEREWLQRRRDIMAAATHLFSTHGWAGTTMQMIADAAEFSVGYLYKHFPGKHELLSAIIEAEIEVLRAERRRLRARYRGQPVETLRHELRWCMEFLKERAELVPLFLTFEDENASQIKPLFDTFMAEDTSLIQQAVDHGEINDHDAELMAAVYNGMVWGIVRWMADHGCLDRLDEIPHFVERYLLDAATPAPELTEGKDDHTS